MTLRVATRRSPLALWQAEHVVSLLRSADSLLDVEIVALETTADARLDLAISQIGGKGAFCKEIQQVVLDGRADIAVHSAKDLQAVTPPGLSLGAFPPRGDVRDVLVGCALDRLPTGAVVATGSQRRRVQLAEVRPDLRFAELRGNIATRLSRLDEFDAVVIAAAALERLGLRAAVVDFLEPSVMLPQVGQGALAVECRGDDAATLRRLASIDHPATRRVVEAERDFLVELGGDCDLPAGAYAQLRADGVLSVVGLLAHPVDSTVDGQPGRIERGSVIGLPADRPGRALAQRLRARL